MGRRLLYQEIQRCKALNFTEHAADRLLERVGSTDFTRELKSCRHGFIDKDNKWHLYFDSGIEIVGYLDTNNILLVMTVFRQTLYQFVKRAFGRSGVPYKVNL